MAPLRPLQLALLATALTGCSGMKQAALESAMNDIWQEGNLDRIDAAYEPELAYEIKQFVRENREIYPDIQLTIDDVIIKGSRYVSLWTISGTHKDLHVPVSLSGVSVRTRTGGKIVKETMFYDVKAIYDQLGFQVVPPEGLSPFGEVTPVVERGETAKPTGEGEPPPEEPAPIEKAPTEGDGG